ncbi:MAG: hypothetical protein RE468_03875 [Acidithiobacillus caldus]|jgi:hypothetical protein|nr:hypothetical protein [Acidithiobacillus caldus]QER43171.1 hypothetical protein F0726_00079 [Acidithiobacillus caldus]WMT47761.1 MAG: hypothetical protein RE468_03875 [Acidithiobacillus caldus]
MVSRWNISAYDGSPPDGENRRIPTTGPLYGREEILAGLDAGRLQIMVWTRKCAGDLQRLDVGDDELPTLLKEVLLHGTYRNSEWCEQGTSGPWAACDAYSHARLEWVPTLGRETRVDYYVKFARNRAGNVLLLVSFHLS